MTTPHFQPLGPNSLFEALQALVTHPLNQADRFVAIEIGPQRLIFSAITGSLFGQGQLKFYWSFHDWSDFVQEKQDDRGELIEEIRFRAEQPATDPVLRELSPNVGDGFCGGVICGQWSEDMELVTVLERAFGTHLTRIGAEGLPSEENIKAYLNNAGYRLNYELQVLTYDLIVEDGQDEGLLRLKPVTVASPNTPLHLNRVLGRKYLVAPVLGIPFDLIFQEVTESGVVVRQRCDRLIAYALQFNFTLSFDGDWRVHYHNAKVDHTFETTSCPPVVHEQDIILEDVAPCLAIVIEATLGMQSLYDQKRRPAGESTPDSASFEVLYKLCVSLLGNFRVDPHWRVRLVFYGDEGDTAQIPPEFIDVGLNKIKPMEPVIQYFPPADRRRSDFIPIDNLVQTLNPRRFLEFQTASADWYRAGEKALQAVNNLSWEQGTKLALWIVQAPPHLHADNIEVVSPYSEYQSDVSFAEEAEKSRERNIQHVVLFVQNDLEPDPDRVRLGEESFRVWQQLTDRIQRIDCAVADQEAFDRLASEIKDRLEVSGAMPVVKRNPDGHQIDPLLPLTYNIDYEQYLFYTE